MKKFFQNLNYSRLSLYTLILMFSFSLVVKLQEGNIPASSNYVVMLILVFTLLIKDKTINGFKKLIESQKDLINHYEDVQRMQREVIAMFKTSIEKKDKMINDLTAQTNGHKKNVSSGNSTKSK